ncbi:MAG TPA: carbamoyltransferase HypF [Polyangiaceae bacterium]|nr:carbamoyltransferase HypF [Polyangiaceae bacterium]
MLRGETIRIRGVVQGVGFRPTVFRVAREHGVRGQVRNDGEGVLIHAWAEPPALDAFVRAIARACPPLAAIDDIERAEVPSLEPAPDTFSIVSSEHSPARTRVAPDAATCAACLAEALDPFSRRYRYPFTNCTHCGPRLSIIRGLPYDRAQTSMASFALCEACRAEYDDPGDRRFHAQPNACHACGPRARLSRADGRALSTASLTQLDDVDAACTLLRRGEILAVKGIGGYHLACDATNAVSVERLRQLKGRDRKPFALMARDEAVIRRFAAPSGPELELLSSAAAPIVLLRSSGAEALPEAVAPGQRTLGFMLPYAPLHHLLLRRLEAPIVLTSGNRSDEPQCIDDEAARRELGDISPYLLWHDRPIENRVDDSVVQVVAGAARVMRRGRGYAPFSLRLPSGFGPAAPALALGAELKNTFCLVQDGHAILSQHVGDLENAATYRDYRQQIELYQRLYQHRAERIVIDGHPEYLSSKLGRDWAQRAGLVLGSVQHHHAHIAACLGENGRPLEAGRVLGVALDGLGFGDDGELWGGEFLLADYRGYERLATFKPVALLGGAQAMREPWRNTYAHLMAEMGWAAFALNYDGLELFRFLASQPLPALAATLAQRAYAPLASSCGRLFDAVAAAVGVCRERASYEGQAAIELEALVDRDALENEDDELAYPFAVPRLGGKGLPYIEPLAMWQAVLGDLILHTPPGVVAARFHKGLAKAVVHMVRRLHRVEPHRFDTVALSGGVFQNATLLEQVVARLRAEGLEVLTHERVPPSDGGLALGQALVDAARQMA